MIIRDITPDDKEQILRLVKMFFSENMKESKAHYSAAHADQHFDVFIQTPGLLALCVEEEGRLVGLIAGVKSSVLFAKELAVQEMIWYVEPKQRKCGIKLLREFERRVPPDVSRILVTGFTGTSLMKLYPRLGYQERQRIFMKELW